MRTIALEYKSETDELVVFHINEDGTCERRISGYTNSEVLREQLAAKDDLSYRVAQVSELVTEGDEDDGLSMYLSYGTITFTEDSPSLDSFVDKMQANQQMCREVFAELTGLIAEGLIAERTENESKEVLQ